MLISPQVATAVNNAASGNSLVGHVVTAATLGDGLASIAVWALQLAHVDPPAAVAQGISAVCIVAASWIMQRASQ